MGQRHTNKIIAAAFLKNPVHLAALGFGTGCAPVAPGTFGTLVGVGGFLLLSGLALWAYLGVVVLMFILGIWLCDKTAADLGVHDHPAIVWDEIVGYLVTMVAIPAEWAYILLGFVLFRLFDIVKPWPISWLDRQIGGGLGIMVDDILAGLYALICIKLLLYFTVL